MTIERAALDAAKAYVALPLAKRASVRDFMRDMIRLFQSVGKNADENTLELIMAALMTYKTNAALHGEVGAAERLTGAAAMHAEIREALGELMLALAPAAPAEPA